MNSYSGSASSLVLPTSFYGQPIIALGSSFMCGNTATRTLTVNSQVIQISDGAFSDFTGVIICDAGSAIEAYAEANHIFVDILEYTLCLKAEGIQDTMIQAGKNVALKLPTPVRGSSVFLGWFEDEECTLSVSLDEGFYMMPGWDQTLYALWQQESTVYPFTYTIENAQVTVTGLSGTEWDIMLPTAIQGMPVTAIADHAFEGSALRSIDLGAVSAVGSYAFRNCGSLTEVQIPDTVTRIGEGAFTGCVRLCTFRLGAGVKSIAKDLFEGCSALSAIFVAETNQQLKSENGVVFSKDGKTLIRYPQGSAVSEYTIPNGVESISPYAFQNCAALKLIILPDTLTDVGEGAFMNCTALTTFTASGLLSLGENAFFSCLCLSNVQLGSQISSIGSLAFASCDSLKEIVLPASLELDTGKEIFTGASITLIGQAGSSVHQYALAYGLSFCDPNAVSVDEIIMNQNSASLNRGERLQLSVSLVPENALIGTEIHWISDNESVAIVDETGMVSALGGGKTIIRAVNENRQYAECAIEVHVPVDSIMIEQTEVILPLGGTAVLSVRIHPASATNKSIIWSSSNESVAAVDESGMVTAIQEGEAIITATAHNGVTTSQRVIVCTVVDSIILEVPETPLYAVPGMNTLQLSVLVLPVNASHPVPVYTVSDQTVASVDENGLVTALQPGEVTIIATADDPMSVSNICQLTISAYDLAEATFQPIHSAVYDGTEHMPDAQINVGNITLTENVDYILSCDEVPCHVGTYTITATGIGVYCGNISQQYTIEKATPEIHFANQPLFWSEDLESLVEIIPACPFTITYCRINADGSKTPLIGIPDESGQYEVTVSVSGLDDVFSVEAVKTIILQTEETIEVLENLLLAPGDSLTLPKPKGYFRRIMPSFTYQSSDEAVCMVDATGRITALKTGETQVTVSIQGGNVSAECLVTVSDNMKILSLPAALITIEEEAFCGLAAVDRIIVGEQVCSIDSRAFADLPAGTQIFLLSDTVQIADDAFEESDILLVCPEGSSIWDFGQKHHLNVLLP